MQYRVNDNELIYMIGENDDYSLECLFKKYEPIVKSICKSFYESNLGIDMDDLVQECNIALYDAYKNFDNTKNVKFYTFANICIRNHIKSYIRNLNLKKYYYLNNSIYIDDLNYELFYFQNYYNYEKEFICIKNMFNYKNSIVFELRYNGFSYKEISILLDVPISTIDGRLCKIRSKLSKYLVNLL